MAIAFTTFLLIALLRSLRTANDEHSLSMLQKIAGILNQKVEIKFSAIAS
ncbi:MAG: hypothetical protein ACK5RE_07410 [Pseudanabaena sp.]|jgi:hypothetical protein